MLNDLNHPSWESQMLGGTTNEESLDAHSFHLVAVNMEKTLFGFEVVRLRAIDQLVAELRRYGVSEKEIEEWLRLPEE